MPIKGLTDQRLSFPRLGTLRKGAPKPNASQPGRDLEYFRFVPAADDEEGAATAAAFCEAYGPEPRVINVYLPHQTIDENWEAWNEEWSASGLVHRCDGETMVLYRGRDGKYHTDTRPCPYTDGTLERTSSNPGCAPVGRLTVIVPEFRRLAYITVETHSKHDIMNLTGQLRGLASLTRNGDLRGIPMVLRRRPYKISTPQVYPKGHPQQYQPTGKRARREKWLLSIEAAPKYVEYQLEASEQAAMGLLSSGLDDDESEIVIVNPKTGEILDAQFTEAEPAGEQWPEDFVPEAPAGDDDPDDDLPPEPPGAPPEQAPPPPQPPAQKKGKKRVPQSVQKRDADDDERQRQREEKAYRAAATELAVEIAAEKAKLAAEIAEVEERSRANVAKAIAAMQETEKANGDAEVSKRIADTKAWMDAAIAESEALDRELQEGDTPDLSGATAEDLYGPADGEPWPEHPQPEQAPKPEKNGRPLSATQIRGLLRYKAKWIPGADRADWTDAQRVLDREPPIDKEAQRIAALLGAAVKQDGQTEKDSARARHQILEWIFGVDSATKLTALEAQAVSAWLADPGNGWAIGDYARDEAAAVLKMWEIERGQQVLPGM